MANTVFTLLSLNSRGLREKNKRESLFYWLKQKQIKVTFLQETYWTEDLIQNIENEWEGPLYLNPGSTHSKGTAILINKNISTSLQVVNIHKSDDGRILLINTCIDDKEFCFINIYAPNNQSERKLFFLKIQKWISKYSINNENIILGGDFNHTESNSLDRNENSCDAKDISSTAYKSLKEKFDLHDIWRDLHPKTKKFTYLDKSRLDKFLVSDNSANYVQSIKIIHSGIKTDHKSVAMNLNIEKNKKGPGNWKLNTSILKDKTYVQNIKLLIMKVKTDYAFLSKQMIWEMCKVKIKEYTIGYCINKQTIKRNIMKELEIQIEQKEQKLTESNYKHKIQLERDTLVNNLHNFVEEQKNGAKIRSRAKWVEEGERCSKYFYSLEKKNYSNNTIKQLKKENGTFTSNNKEILEEEYAFYKNLYKADDIPKEDIKTYLRDTGNINILYEHEANTLEGIISETECQNALRNMKLNKSPGSDGLPVEFYVSFWQDVKTLVVESLNEGYEIGELSVTQKRGILNLIFKKEDKTLLSNWRPISLLNTDYKILAHVLANRLKKNIGKLVHTDQSGYIKGRNICFNIRLIQDVIDYFENGEEEGAIIFLDFQKAFDTVSHEFLMNAFSRYNFGESFKKWVNVIYNKAESCVTNNGWTSKPLSINKGIRQGCPLSALLFLLVAEILAVRVRSNSNIGLKVETEENVKNIQISQLADDTTLFFKNENDILVGLKIVEQFSRVSGLKLNKRKSEGLWLGQGENRNDNFAGINWGKNSVKALGVYFGYNKKEMENKNWTDKIEKIKSSLRCWNIRDLSLQGRILIIKTMALSKVVYLAAALLTPEWAINEINKELFAFLWKYKRDKIARKVVINDVSNGGLNMIDFRIFCMSMKAVWAYRLLKSKLETWSIIPKKYFEKCDLNKMLCMNANQEKHIPIFLPRFYKEVIHCWHLSGGGNKAPKNANEIRTEILWGNKHIQTKGKTIYFENWRDSNINFVDDLLDANGNFISGEELFLKLKNKKNWIIEYKMLQKAIPKVWKEKLVSSNMPTHVKKQFRPFLLIDNKVEYNLPKKARDYYNIMISTTRKRTFLEKYWSNIFPDRPTWTKVYEGRFKNQNIKKLADFNFKIFHKILPCGENLFQWKISSTNKCRFGCPLTETYNHLFVTCPKQKDTIEKIERVLKSLGFELRLSYKILILGYKISYHSYSEINQLLSHIFFAIYKYWIKNDYNLNKNNWIFSQLNQWQNIYSNTAWKFDLLDKFIAKWTEINTIK